MNGMLLTILLAGVGALFGIIQALIGIVMKMHMASDEESRIRTEKEITALRERTHDLADKLSGLLAKEHMRRQGDRDD